MRRITSATFTSVAVCLFMATLAQGQASPSELNLDLAEGAVVVEQVSWTFEPTCIRAWEVDVLTSDPAVHFENLSGVLVNGCGGSTSSFDVQFTGDGVSRNFDLLIVDVFSNEPHVLAVIPASISVPEPSGLMGLAWIPIVIRRQRRVRCKQSS